MKTLILAVFAFFVFSGTAFSYEMRSGQTVVIAQDQTISDDLSAAGSEVVLRGRVVGDAFLAGQNVRSEGSVTGSLNAAGGTLNVSGTLGNNAQLAGGTVIVDGANIGNNAAIFGGKVDVRGGTRVPRDLVVSGGEISIRGDVGRNLRASGNVVRIGGTVGGDAVVNATQLVLLPNANIQGNLNYTSPNKVRMEPGARVGGTTNYRPAERRDGRGAAVFFLVFHLLSMALVGILLLAVAPVTVMGIAGMVRRSFGWSLLWGFVFAAAVLAAIVALMVTILGIPLAFILLAVYLIMLYLSHIFIALAVGGLIFKNTEPGSRTRYWALLLGLLILVIVELIPVIGGLVAFVALLAGFGAQLLYLYDRYRPQRTEGQIVAQ